MSPSKKAGNKHAGKTERCVSFANAKHTDFLNSNIRLSFITTFSILATCHSLAAAYAPIQDCDEVFNYWEPTHYLTNAHGLQTWEYAPRFAIRSWSYVGVHALPIQLLKIISPVIDKAALFYGLRLSLGLICAFCEASFINVIGKTLNERIAIFFLIICSTSPGMFHASVAYLPSSFAMYTAMLGASAFMDWREKLHTAQGIFWFGLGACLGWPFAAALSMPYLLEELYLALLTDQAGRIQFGKRLLSGTGAALLALAAQLAIDAVFYRKFAFVPLNIVLYNVFSSKGPDLYGVEPWHFYLRNLALNFHLWLVLALLALPLLLVQVVLDGSWKRYSRAAVFLSPMYLWLAIFTLQPHKEERFMYPAYPFLMLNAAYSLHAVLSALGSNSPDSLASRIPLMLRLSAVLVFLITALALSILRTVGTWSAFAAPLEAYSALPSTSTPSNVCLGKEWYRFPSHYLLPDGYTAKFIRSEFHGLLPGEFAPSSNYTSSYAGTWMEPDGMNDENLEDLSKYVDIEECDFLVDTLFPSTVPTGLEQAFVQDPHWQRVKCVPFLDAASTPVIPRLFWTPALPQLPRTLRRVWGEYCLLQRAQQG